MSNEEILIIYCETGNLIAKNYVIERNLNLVRRIAHSFRNKCREPYDDLFQVGTLGLIKAVNKWQQSAKNKTNTSQDEFDIIGKTCGYKKGWEKHLFIRY